MSMPILLRRTALTSGRLLAYTPSRRCLHASISIYADQRSSSKTTKQQQQQQQDKQSSTTEETKSKDALRKMTAKERDEMLLQRMKDKMGAEGDQAWEDGRPAESGLPRHVKNNMFRII